MILKLISFLVPFNLFEMASTFYWLTITSLYKKYASSIQKPEVGTPFSGRLSMQIIALLFVQLNSHKNVSPLTSTSYKVFNE